MGERVCCGSRYVDDRRPRCSCVEYDGDCDHPAVSEAWPTPAFCPDTHLVDCSQAGTACEHSSDCCYDANCTNFDSMGSYCAAFCTSGSDCQSGCCVPLQDGSASVCAPQSYCA